MRRTRPRPERASHDSTCIESRSYAAYSQVRLVIEFKPCALEERFGMRIRSMIGPRSAQFLTASIIVLIAANCARHGQSDERPPQDKSKTVAAVRSARTYEPEYTAQG